jgi:hypothetical protein
LTPPDSAELGSVDSGCKVRKRTKFPELCVRCGAAHGLIARQRTFAYIPHSIYVAFLFGCVGMVLGIVLCLAARETTQLTVPTCARCARAWDRAVRLPIFFLAGSLLTTFAASGLVWALDADRMWLALGVGGLITSVGPIALHFRGRKDRVWAKNIDETTATLMGLHPAVIAELSAR